MIIHAKTHNDNISSLIKMIFSFYFWLWFWFDIPIQIDLFVRNNLDSSINVDFDHYAKKKMVSIAQSAYHLTIELKNL